MFLPKMYWKIKKKVKVHYSLHVECVTAQLKAVLLYISLFFLHPFISSSTSLIWSVIIDHFSLCMPELLSYVSRYVIRVL